MEYRVHYLKSSCWAKDEIEHKHDNLVDLDSEGTPKMSGFKQVENRLEDKKCKKAHADETTICYKFLFRNCLGELSEKQMIFYSEKPQPTYAPQKTMLVSLFKKTEEPVQRGTAVSWICKPVFQWTQMKREVSFRD